MQTVCIAHSTISGYIQGTGPLHLFKDVFSPPTRERVDEKRTSKQSCPATSLGHESAHRQHALQAYWATKKRLGTTARKRKAGPSSWRWLAAMLHTYDHKTLRALDPDCKSAGHAAGALAGPIRGPSRTYGTSHAVALPHLLDPGAGVRRVCCFTQAHRVLQLHWGAARARALHQHNATGGLGTLWSLSNLVTQGRLDWLH